MQPKNYFYLISFFSLGTRDKALLIDSPRCQDEFHEEHWERILFPASWQMPDQHGGQSKNLNMETESSSKKDIFKDVRFFLTEENNEEVCDKFLSTGQKLLRYSDRCIQRQE